MTSTIPRPEPIPLWELRRREASGFTAWLADNLDFVGDKLGIDLRLVEREKVAGDFAADVLAEAGDGSLAIIGNQSESDKYAINSP